MKNNAIPSFRFAKMFKPVPKGPGYPNTKRPFSHSGIHWMSEFSIFVHFQQKCHFLELFFSFWQSVIHFLTCAF